MTGIDNSKPAKAVAKVVSLHISVGNSDRDRLLEEFIENLRSSLGVVEYGADGVHASTMSAYYVVDGKVCLQDDFDSRKQNFKDGALPPPWAGGPPPKTVAPDAETTGETRGLSAREFDRRYPNGNGRTAPKIPKADEGLEEFEWDLADVTDNEKLAKTKTSVRKVVRRAKKEVQETPAPKKRVIRRAK